MKTFFLLSAFLFLSFSFKIINEPCDLQCLQTKAQAALSDFSFIKQFPVEISDTEKQFEISYVLSNNTSYRIAIADKGIKGKRMVIKLLDRNKKLISTNLVPGTKDFSPNIDFVCPATGVYYVEASIEKNNSGNGLVILGFKKKKEVDPSSEVQ